MTFEQAKSALHDEVPHVKITKYCRKNDVYYFFVVHPDNPKVKMMNMYVVNRTGGVMPVQPFNSGVSPNDFVEVKEDPDD